jgi:Amt family ammonium transporter
MSETPHFHEFTEVVDPGLPSTAYILTNAALVFIMTPALGLFYAGMSHSKNALTVLTISFQCMIIVTIQWFILGFSLSFSDTGSAFLGNFEYALLFSVDAKALPMAMAVPGVAFCLYQLQFAAVTPAIIFGSVAERARILPAMVFIFVWTTLVYDVVAYWTWGYKGWIRNMSCLDTLQCGEGAYDFAGGGPIHIASGFSGLAYCLVVGKRIKVREIRPHHLSNVVLGTGLMWMGWFGFNGGSAIASTPRAATAALVTTISAACSGFTWTMFDYFFSKRVSALSVCSGIVAGLVTITPASGFVAPWAAAIIGITSGFLVNLGCRCKNYLGYDDTLDAFGIHGIGGMVGGILTGVFHQKYITELDGVVSTGGAFDGNWNKVGQQIAACLAVAAWSFFVSYALLLIINIIPGLHLRITTEEETRGQDYSEIGEAAYIFGPAHSTSLEKGLAQVTQLSGSQTGSQQHQV